MREYQRSSLDQVSVAELTEVFEGERQGSSEIMKIIAPSVHERGRSVRIGEIVLDNDW